MHQEPRPCDYDTLVMLGISANHVVYYEPLCEYMARVPRTFHITEDDMFFTSDIDPTPNEFYRQIELMLSDKGPCEWTSKLYSLDILRFFLEDYYKGGVPTHNATSLTYPSLCTMIKYSEMYPNFVAPNYLYDGRWTDIYTTAVDQEQRSSQSTYNPVLFETLRKPMPDREAELRAEFTSYLCVLASNPDDTE